MKNVLFATILFLISVACQTKSNNENLSETKSFAPKYQYDTTEESDFRVLAIPTAQGLYCVVKLGPKNKDPILELWTPQGTIDDKGMRQSLRYAGYEQHFINSIFGFASRAGGSVIGDSISPGPVVPTYPNGQMVKFPSNLSLAFGFVAGKVATGAMTLKAGEGQTEESKTAMTVLSNGFLLDAWLAERILRGNRFVTAKSPFTVHRVPTTQLALWKERLHQIPPTVFNGCEDYQPETSTSSNTP